MKLRLACVVAGFFCRWFIFTASTGTVAQTSAQTASALPRLVRFGGTAKDLNTNPLTGVVGVTFALYSEQTGGAPLWLETQNVTADGTGHYVALVGATRPEGLPTELFTSEQARWVGVQVSGQAEQPRVLLVSAPYALKAGDAETIGGLLPSAFVLAAPPTRRAATESAVTAQVTSGLTPNVAGTGTTHFIPLWTNSTGTLGNSALFQSGTGSTAGIGIDTTTPAHKLEVDSGNALVRGPQNFKAAGATAYLYVGDTSHPIEAIWGSGLAIGAYQVPQAIFIQDKTGNVGIGTTTPTSGILTTVATSASVVGLSATGWTQPFTAGVGPVNGGDAIHATGGNWYSPISFCCSGGAGLVATGGIGEGMGPGVVANGASGPGTGGLGIDATGGSGDAYGGSGGSFIAGDGRYGGGEGIDAAAEGVSTSDAAFFTSNGGDCDFNCAGYFSGDINVTGAIYAGTKDFRIDHPLDPENKYLQHASVESSEMKNCPRRVHRSWTELAKLWCSCPHGSRQSMVISATN